jgi:hypothetical protein
MHMLSFPPGPYIIIITRHQQQFWKLANVPDSLPYLLVPAAPLHAALDAAVHLPLAFTDAVLVLGATGRLGRVVVQQVNTLQWMLHLPRPA